MQKVQETLGQCSHTSFVTFGWSCVEPGAGLRILMVPSQLGIFCDAVILQNCSLKPKTTRAGLSEIPTTAQNPAMTSFMEVVCPPWVHTRHPITRCPHSVPFFCSLSSAQSHTGFIFEYPALGFHPLQTPLSTLILSVCLPVMKTTNHCPTARRPWMAQ